ncbi:MAG: hypothetical protein QGH33_19560 [Pirellulaceae bacterium]|nr:hypothetical protein [Pirellulaceae bacterium]
MKRFASVLLAAGFAITLAGCTPTTVSDTTGTSSNTSEAISSEFTLVTLKVPNMV